LMELGDSDALSMRYLMYERETDWTVGKETDVESQVRSRLTCLIRDITHRMRWFITRPPIITKSA
jgi:hypothetical protein